MYETVLWPDVVAWQAVCQCGWVGQRWEKATTIPGEYGGQDPSDAYLPDGTTVEDQAEQAWAAHVEPLDRLAQVRAAVAGLEHARQVLDDAVLTARTATPPATWADIGQATGMSKQAAHERWGSLRH
jgi:hypothetical protein